VNASVKVHTRFEATSSLPMPPRAGCLHLMIERFDRASHSKVLTFLHHFKGDLQRSRGRAKHNGLQF
jgi:hypothetical protein